MIEDIGEFKGNKYRFVNFVASTPDDIACNHCAFEPGKCRGAIWILGQCYIVEGDEVVKNVYYEEVEEYVLA